MLLIRTAAEREERQARRLAKAARDASQLEPDTPDPKSSVEDLSSVQTTESVGSAVPELLASTPAVQLEPDPSPNTDTDTDTVLEKPHPGEHEPQGSLPLERIGELVAGPRPATWVFCGDGPAETAFPDQFATELRTTYRRPLDVVVNTLVPGSPIETVLENLEWQLARFHPDVVNLVIGPAAASDDSDFAATLAQLVDQLQDLGAALVIHAPDPDGSDELQAQVDEIRNLALRRAILLVEHAGVDGDQERVDRLCQTLRLQRPGS
jgi:hypothetical protein